jgi:predicted dehydrogenase
MEPITIGIVGGGMFGAKHVDAFRADGRARVKWLCDRSEALARQWSGDPRVERATADVGALLADPEVEAVVVATPPGTHAELALSTLRAGKHLLLEKPMAIARAEAAAVVEEAARRPGQVVLEASCRHARLQPKFAFVKALVGAGRLGRVYHLHHVMLSPETFLDWNPRAGWSMERRLAGGGPVLDWGVYDLSFLLGILGDAPALSAVSAFHQGGLRSVSGDVEQHAAGFLTFEGGLTCAYERGAGVHGQARSETRVHGTRAGLRLSYPTWESPEVELFEEGPDGKPRREVLTVDLAGHADDNAAVVAHFLDCVEGKAAPAMPLERAYKHLDILLRLLEAQSP